MRSYCFWTEDVGGGGWGGGAEPLLVNAFSRCPLLLHLNKMSWSTSYFLPGSDLGANSSVHPKLHSDQHACQCAGQGKNGNSLVPVMPMGLLLHWMSWIPVIIIHPVILWVTLTALSLLLASQTCNKISPFCMSSTFGLECERKPHHTLLEKDWSFSRGTGVKQKKRSLSQWW